MTDSDSPTQVYTNGQRCGVLLPVPLNRFNGGQVYDYRVPEGFFLSPGDFVRVPLGPRKLTGVVWGAGQGDVEDHKLKTVIEKRPVPPMAEVTRKFVDWVADYTLSSPGQVLKMAMSVPDALEPPKGVKAFRIADPLPDIKMTPTRERVLQVLGNGPPLSASEAALEAGCSPAVVAGLAKAGALVEVEQVRARSWAQPDPDRAGPELSAAQREAARALTVKTRAGGYAPVVLDGVPGSGKTEVYFEAVAEALRQDKQVLVLLPEIALGAQWLSRFEARFGAKPAQWHSELGPRELRRKQLLFGVLSIL